MNLGQNEQQKQAKEQEEGLAYDGPRTVTATLPCLSGLNCRLGLNTGEEPKSEKLKSSEYRTVWGLRQNVKAWCEEMGLENLVFFTMTCRDNVRCKREYARRYKRFRNHFKDAGFQAVLVKVDEPQKRGAWHSHCIVYVGEDVRTGFNFEHYKHAKQLDELMYRDHGGHRNAPKELRKLHGKSTTAYTASASPKLRAMWHALRKASRKSGFGRCEVIPVQHSKAVSDYVGKYLAKGIGVKTPQTYRMRKINYCRGIYRKVSSQFQWAWGRSQDWRKNLGAWAKMRGIQDDDTKRIRKYYGKSWAYILYDEIMHVGKRERFLASMGEYKDNIESARRQYDYVASGGSISSGSEVW